MSILAFTPLFLQIVLLWVLTRRGAYTDFPWFFGYTVFSVIATTARFVVRNQPDEYFWLYWSTEAVFAILGIAVLYEIFASVFGNLTRIWWFRLIFPLTVLLACVLTMARGHTAPVQIKDPLSGLIVQGELAVRFLQVSMFVLLVALVPLFGLRWRQYPFGIAAGFGLYATMALLATTKFSDLGTTFKFLWGWSLVVAYSVAILVWLWFFSAPEKPEPRLPGQVPTSLADLKRYIELMRRMRR
jgi:hypothetical protein